VDLLSPLLANLSKKHPINLIQPPEMMRRHHRFHSLIFPKNCPHHHHHHHFQLLLWYLPHYHHLPALGLLPHNLLLSQKLKLASLQHEVVLKKSYRAWVVHYKTSKKASKTMILIGTWYWVLIVPCVGEKLP
jgi:hypothetical protein